MKKGLSTSLKSALIAGSFLCSSAAFAEDHSGVYWKLNSGVNLLNKIDVSVADFAGSASLKSKAGFAINSSVGFRFDSIAVELESGYSSNSWSSLGGLSVGGSGSQVPILANVLFLPKFGESVSAELGFGLGASVMTADLSVPGLGSTSSETQTTFLGQARAGLHFKVSENVGLDVGYRLRIADGPTFSSGIKTDTIVGHVISAGVTVSF